MAIVVGKAELILICLVAVALLALVARKIRVPYPILLTCGGVLLALVPGLPAIQLEPQLVFNLFLPPLLYPAAVFTSWRDFRANLQPILFLAIVLVLLTMTVTAYLFGGCFCVRRDHVAPRRRGSIISDSKFARASQDHCDSGR